MGYNTALMAFKKILIANRGEIAVRIIRACRELDIGTVAVYSEPDREALHVKFADEAYCIGPASPQQSYLNIPSIISVAEISGADAIHPGYGFLSENSRFADVCESHKIVFIGPSPKALHATGDKSMARALAADHGISVIPGSDGLVESEGEGMKLAGKIGYPVAVKATAGGGGKGLRVAKDGGEFAVMFNTAKAEAKAAFGNAGVYIEKYLDRPRHIEVQILVDARGHGLHFGERECSIQRRHQKLLEEATSPFVDDKLRKKMGESALRMAKAADYVGAGTVEFLVDQKHHFYFMEMNARIQVEHPVTEMITGWDLVKEQIRIAMGDHLNARQGDIHLQGHAIECRINAEDPYQNFMPSPGNVSLYLPPSGPGIRVDSHLYSGYPILPFYDSLCAKLIAWGRDRAEAIVRMRRALDEMILDGVRTTIPFQEFLLTHRNFINGDVSTDFVEKHYSEFKDRKGE